ncbi:uncharacterized protein PV07_08838 [Cladophialophora immunda]|uniref:Zn(2)-C6 fungal-type domain-containing protein n=1 Tax=Cladophialophora immunda TaxID=569365 RepID=A0A0D2AKZ8_9EURO|nr:uncharacterized protein PV07_08838 [Cladophialophora immunda]KIW25677.1 hypothetical protein PV07_08838 [Cladophialophora immunda]
MSAKEDVAINCNSKPPPAGKEQRKRRRILLACRTCRARKQRCDGSQPTCQHCAVQNLDCHYESASQKADVTRLYVHNLLKRIDHLEEELSGARPAKRRGDVASLASEEPDSTLPTSKLHGTRPAQHGQSPQHTPLLGLRQPHDAVARGTLTELELEQAVPKPAYPTPETVEPPTQGYLGAANTLTFCQAVLEQDDLLEQHQDLSSSPTPRRPATASQSTPRIHSISLGDLADSWPQRYLGDHLVDCYMELCYPQYPFMHGPTFKRRYESMWTSRERQTDAWIATVNTIFALGCQFSPNISPELGEEFFKKATSLIKFEILGVCTLESLQALVLMSLYLQSSANLNHSWNVIGLAIRQAQSLGLHLQKTYQRSRTPLVREVQKRIWTACYVLDSVSAMMLGRPPMISPDAFALIEGITLLDDDQIPNGRALPPSSPTSPTAGAEAAERLDNTGEEPRVMAFFAATIRQCGFMREVVKVYDLRTEHSRVLDIDDRFCQWMANFPPHLHPSNTSDTDKRFWQQRVVLTSRFLNLRILFHRPCVMQISSVGKTVTPFEPIRGAANEKLATLRAEVCINAAIEQIQHISRSYKRGLQSAWWYDLNYIFSATSILLATQIAQQHCNRSYSHYVKLAEDVIRGMQQTGKSMAGRYLEMLEQLQRHLAYKTSPAVLQRGAHSQPSRTASPSRRNPLHGSRGVTENGNSGCDPIRDLVDEDLEGNLAICDPDLPEPIRDEDVSSLFASSSFPWNIDLDSFLLDDNTLDNILDPTDFDAIV